MTVFVRLLPSASFNLVIRMARCVIVSSMHGQREQEAKKL